MKRYRILIPVLVLCCVLAGCRGDEKKQITLNLRVPPLAMTNVGKADTLEADDFMRSAAEKFSAQYEEADVSFNIEMFEYTKETDAIEGNYDTDRATDILYEGYFNMGTYVHSGRVVPLDDVISDELRADIDDSIWEMSMLEGKTYMMPYQSSQNILIYNKELFRQCGLDQYIGKDEVISGWTLKEWEDILDTLAEKLPGSCYPMMMYAKNEQGDTHIMTYLRSHGSEFFDDEGNFHLKTEEGIAGLQWLQDGCKKGWFPPHCEHLEVVDNTELFVNGQLGIVMTNNSSFGYFDGMDWGCVNFPDITGDGITTSFVTGFEVFDNGDEDKVKAAKAFVKYVSETEEWADYSTGGIPARNSVSERHHDDMYMIDAFLQNNKNVVDFTRNNPNWRGVREVFWPCIRALLTGEMTPEEAASSVDADCNAAIEEGRRESTLHE